MSTFGTVNDVPNESQDSQQKAQNEFKGKVIWLDAFNLGDNLEFTEGE